jgi:hypothetical protein
LDTSSAKICSKFHICPTSVADVRQHFEDEDRPELFLKNQLVPRGEHTLSVILTRMLMLYGEKIAVCSDALCTQQKNTMCGQNIEFFVVKPAGTGNNHWASKVSGAG